MKHQEDDPKTIEWSCLDSKTSQPKSPSNISWESKGTPPHPMPTPSQEVTSPYQAFSHNQPFQMAPSFTGVVGKDAMRLVFFQTSWRGAKETLTLNHSSVGCLFDLFISLISLFFVACGCCFCPFFFFWRVPFLARHPALSKTISVDEKDCCHPLSLTNPQRWARTTHLAVVGITK